MGLVVCVPSCVGFIDGQLVEREVERGQARGVKPHTILFLQSDYLLSITVCQNAKLVL